MTIVESIKTFFMRLLGITLPSNEIVIEETPNTESMPVTMEELNQDKFFLQNVIMEKIDYLEQYIKIFSLTFPEAYEKYSTLIQSKRQSYEEELKKYQKCFEGHIIFSIDPENESQRLIEITKLEAEIVNFVEYEVRYKTSIEKFSKMCIKLNQFYNALIDTKKEIAQIQKQIQNANTSLLRLIEEVKETTFFNKDSRKKEDILSYVVYSDYIIFKSNFRCNTVSSFDEYLENESAVYSLFSSKDYMQMSFKYFIDDLERIQEYIINNLSNTTQCQYLLNSCVSLQERLAQPKTEDEQKEYYDELIKFENTIDNLVEADNISFNIETPECVSSQNVPSLKDSVNKIAIDFLDVMNSVTSKVLIKVIASFQYEISWREFYFLCKIFEVYDEAIRFASTTIFDTVKSNFLRLEEKYSQYTNEYIRGHKQKLLAHSSGKNNKYILFMTLGSLEKEDITSLFDNLKLDYKFVDNDVYLNHSYFNGFKNLEQNFGNFVIM